MGDYQNDTVRAAASRAVPTWGMWSDGARAEHADGRAFVP